MIDINDEKWEISELNEDESIFYTSMYTAVTNRDIKLVGGWVFSIIYLVGNKFDFALKIKCLVYEPERFIRWMGEIS